MEDRVFISYAHKDKKMADALCHEIEKSGIKCWYAPRDIEPGANWAKSISIAIENSSFFILVLSKSANVSDQILREINLAVKHKLCIVTFRVAAVEISKELDYYLSVAHWMDALTKPLETHIHSLVQYLQVTIGSGANLAERIDKIADPLNILRGKRKGRKSTGKTVLISLLTIVLLAAIGIGTLYLLIRNGIYYLKVGSLVFDISSFSIVKEKKEYISIEMRVLMSQNGMVKKHFISDDNTLYAEPLDNGLIHIWRVSYDLNNTEKPLYTIYHDFETDEKMDITFSSDKTLLIIAQEHRIVVYDLKSGILRYSYESPSLEIMNAKITQNNDIMTILSGKTQQVDDWGQPEGKTTTPKKQINKKIWTSITTVDISKKTTIYDHNFQYGETPYPYGFTKDGRYVCAYTDYDKAPFLIGALEDVKYVGVECLKKCYKNVDFSPFDPDGRYYLHEVNGEDRKVMSLESGKEVLELFSEEHQNRRQKYAYYCFLTNAGRIIRNSKDASALYDIATGEKIGEITGYNDWSQYFCYNINHSDLVVGVESREDNKSHLVIADPITGKTITNIYSLNNSGLPENAVRRDLNVIYTDEGALLTLYYDINEQSFVTLKVYPYENELITRKTLVSKQTGLSSV